MIRFGDEATYRQPHVGQSEVGPLAIITIMFNVTIPNDIIIITPTGSRPCGFRAII